MAKVMRFAVPLLLDQEREYAVEIWSDDDLHYIEISRHNLFAEASMVFEELTSPAPDMRVVMRQRWQVYRTFVPRRLRSSRG